MAQTASRRRTLISDGPIVDLVQQLADEADRLMEYVPQSDTTGFAQRWLKHLRRAVAAATQEPLMVSVADLAARPTAARSARTMRRMCEDGKVSGAELRGGKWMVGPGGATELLS
jgi:hypothetical protein